MGFTKDSAEERAKQLFTTEMPHPFQVEYYHLNDEVEKVEAIVHAELAKLGAQVRGKTIARSSRCSWPCLFERSKSWCARARRSSYEFVGPIPAKICGYCGHTFHLKEGERYTYCPECNR